MISQMCDSFPESMIQIENMYLTVEDTMRLVILCRTDAQNWKMEFDNISELTIRELNFPAIISGFEIRDNLCRGWAKDARYTVRDFEEGKLSFHCQEIRVVKIEDDWKA